MKAKISDYVKALIQRTRQGSHVIDGKISQDRVVGYFETILVGLEELESKADKWNSEETQRQLGLALELGRQVRGLVEHLEMCSDEELVKWFREQKQLELEVKQMKLADKKTGLFYEDGDPICIGDEVKLITGFIGEIVYECGVHGVATIHCIDYDKIQQAMDSLHYCCGNKYNGCMNDNFVSLWELYQNFNCEEDILHVIEKLEDGERDGL